MMRNLRGFDRLVFSPARQKRFLASGIHELSLPLVLESAPSRLLGPDRHHVAETRLIA